MEGPVVTSIVSFTALRSGMAALCRCHVKCMVKGFREIYNSVGVVAEKNKDIVLVM